MKIINNNHINKIFNILNIDVKDLCYYTSGKCSDLYIYNDMLIKIIKWYIKKDNEDSIISKFDFKINFINYLNSKHFNCLELFKFDNTYIKIIFLENTYYIIYKMKYLNNSNYKYSNIQLGKLLKQFHVLSRNYKKIETSANWEEEFNSVYSCCKNKKIKEKLLEYYKKIKKLKTDNYGIIHYDSNKYNYTLLEDKLYLIDIDNICYGWYTMDLANYLFSVYNIDFLNGKFLSLNKLKHIAIEFLDSYDFDYKYIDELNLFFNYRFIYMYVILCNKIKNRKIKDYIENLVINGEILLT